MAKAQLKADFTSDITTGCAPVLVRFQDQTTGNAIAWLWDLGNGTTSFQKNPTTFYFDAGKYTIKLRVTDGRDTQTIIKTQFITVNDLPVVNFRASDTTGCIPLNVAFTDLSNPLSGTIKSYEWDFGDGAVAGTAVTSHRYILPGNYSVSLKVTNSFGCSRLISRRNYIKALDDVKADFNFTSGLICSPPANIQFNDASSGKNISTYFWNFGDAASSTSKSPLHTYTTAGSFAVSLIVKNAVGCSDTMTKSNLINIFSFKAGFIAPDRVCSQTPVNFANTTAPAPTSVVWDFGDGTSSTALNPSKVFTTPGTYTVALQSFNGGCNSIFTKTITVLPIPQADFTTSNQLSTCITPLSVQFSSAATSVRSYLWDFGDGAKSTVQNPSHTYNKNGSFSVTLEVTGINGCTNRLEKPNLVYYGPPVIQNLIGVANIGCVPAAINASANVVSSERIVSYLWDFGDGVTSALTNAPHTYANAGTYSVKLDIKTENGCVASYTMADAVKLNVKPTAKFTISSNQACAFEAINFIDSSTGTVSDLAWSFGDGAISTEKNPVHQYADTGVFTVRLVANNITCTDAFTLTEAIRIKPPIAKFTSQFDCASAAIRQFSDLSTGGINYKWDFGDSTNSDQPNPTHTYTKSGLYTVNLEVLNGNCKDTAFSQVLVINENPQLSILASSSCVNTVTTLKAVNIDTALVSNYEWALGDGTTVSTSLSTVNYKYPASGSFTPSVTITDISGCKKIVVSTAAITVQGPKANFALETNSCVNSPVTFKDLSVSQALFPVNQYVWHYGDGKTDTLQKGPFTHTYPNPGSYNVTLIVSDINGCRDTLTKTPAVNITQPIARFSVSDSLNCVLREVSFNNESTGNDLKYLWDLGDGTLATSRDTVHRYATEATYTVHLIVSDVNGCRDTIVKSNAVKVANVKASIAFNDSTSSCPPFAVDVTNRSTNFSSFIWDFDDGSFSVLDTPSHYYNLPGVYNIKIIATGYGECYDTAYRAITLYGPSGELKYNPTFVCAPGTITLSATTLNRASFIWDFGDGSTAVTQDSTTTHTYINPGKYRPKLLLFDDAGCRVPISGRDTITLASVDANIKTLATTYCDSARLQLLDSSQSSQDPIAKYIWTFGDGNIDSVNRNPVHMFSSAGNFGVRLQVVTARGCTDTDSITAKLKIVNSPVISISANKGVCQDELILFNANINVPDTSALLWRWNFGNGTAAQVQDPPALRFVQAGNYNVSVTAVNSSNCPTTALFPLQVNPTPAVNAGPDTTICLGQNFTLSPLGADTYTWNANPVLSCTNCTNPVSTPKNADTYVVNGTSIFGCKNSDSIKINVVQPFAFTSSPENDTLCLGESVQLVAQGAELYNWLPAAGLSDPAIASPVARPNATTTYQVIASDRYRCFFDTGYVAIRVYPIPVFSINRPNVTIQGGNTTTVNTTSSADITRWRWIPSLALSCSNCAEPVATPKSTTTYTAYAFNDGGCKTEDKVTISVLCNNANIFIPNTFSPNGDGMNDVFFVRGKGIASIRAFTIFNRLGAVVFQKSNFSMNDEASGWNGNFNSKPLPQDVFIYKVDVVCENNALITLTGNVTLVR